MKPSVAHRIRPAISCFSKPGVQEFVLRIKKHKATGYDGMPAEIQKVFYIIRDKIEMLTNMVNKIKNESEFSRDWKIAIMYPVN